MADGQFRCHCGAAYHGSDHCPNCGCEQYEGRQRCNVEPVAWFRVTRTNGEKVVGPMDSSGADGFMVAFETFEWDEVRSVEQVERKGEGWVVV